MTESQKHGPSLDYSQDLNSYKINQTLHELASRFKQNKFQENFANLLNRIQIKAGILVIDSAAPFSILFRTRSSLLAAISAFSCLSMSST